MSRPYTTREDAFIASERDRGTSLAQIAQSLGRTLSSIRGRCTRMERTARIRTLRAIRGSNAA